MINFFQRAKNSALIASVIIIVNLWSYFADLRTTLTRALGLIGITNPTISDVVLILGGGILLILALFIVDFILERFFQTQLISYKTEPLVTFSSDASGERIHDFQCLRVHAKKSIFVMGIGMTNFSVDYSLLEELLNKNISVRLLMIDPTIVVPTLSGKNYQVLMLASQTIISMNTFFVQVIHPIFAPRLTGLLRSLRPEKK